MLARRHAVGLGCLGATMLASPSVCCCTCCYTRKLIPAADERLVRSSPTTAATMQTFEQLDLTEQTRKAIADMDFSHMTEVQARTIPHLLVGRDVLGAAKTGAQRWWL